MSSEFLIGNRESGGGLKIQCFYAFWIVERKKDGKFQVGSADFGGVLAGQSPCVVERSGFLSGGEGGTHWYCLGILSVRSE